MASGLVALLDDVAGIAKIAAASIDDMAGAAGRAGSKAVGVVVDDAAVTPGYAMGFTPDRELPIVIKIAIGSLRNKFLFLLPGALALSAFAPWAVTPILMLGGAYLSFEAVEKIIEALGWGHHGHEAVKTEELALSSAELEAQKVGGAIRTDLILSAEIMAIALSDVAGEPLPIQAGALALVGLAITLGVYGVVGLIVKMDDIGLSLSRRRNPVSRGIGRALVKGMPAALGSLSVIGTAAMLWVGGGIIVHGLDHFHIGPVPHLVHELGRIGGMIPGIAPVTAWIATAVGSAMAGAVVGGAVVLALKLVPKRGG